MRDHAQALGEPIIRAGLLAGATSRFVLVLPARKATLIAMSTGVHAKQEARDRWLALDPAGPPADDLR